MKMQKKKIILCFGTWDIIHDGHKEFLKDAKSRGDYLITIVVSDEIVYENKGRYPKNKQKDRALNLKKMGIADQIIGVSNNKGLNFKLYKKINPDLIVLGYDQENTFLKKLEEYLKKEGVLTKWERSKEFAGGIHSSHLQNARESNKRTSRSKKPQTG
jgi:cytidyltransferase-like protein